MSFLARAKALARDILPPLVVRTANRALKELRLIITREPKIALGEFDPATLPATQAQRKSQNLRG